MSRHQNEDPYTSVGEIVLAMNPYKWLPIYTEEIRTSINRRHIFDTNPPQTNAVPAKERDRRSEDRRREDRRREGPQK
ncbi:hypothetical protein TrRE_jg4266 [Triparma retinervis]|uniref:Myosin motor domain-containing protein n=1 Tax=Triparma retinervis TaxID=2557542 RepID=A0A9W7FGT5_9STRA|nr:hypothetical protein TrRE_jg4266 [Triparma retinervis]